MVLPDGAGDAPPPLADADGEPGAFSYGLSFAADADPLGLGAPPRPGGGRRG